MKYLDCIDLYIWIGWL